MPYSYTWTVRSGDTDFSGRVYTPAVVEQVVLGMEELMAEIGWSVATIHERGLLNPTAHVAADYVEPFGVEDRIEVELIPQVGESAVTISAVGRRDGRIAFEADLVNVFVDDETGEKVPVPDDVADRLAEFT